MRKFLILLAALLLGTPAFSQGHGYGWRTNSSGGGGLTSPVLTTQGGTGLTSYTAGDTVYYLSGTTFSKLAKGSALQYYRMNAAGTAPEWATPPFSTFGGDGSDGAITKGAVTESTIKQYNATTFSQTAATTYTVKSGTVINTNSTSTINGTLAVSADIAGGAAQVVSADYNGVYGSGLSPGSTNVKFSLGLMPGGGGGFGGAGGSGYNYNAGPTSISTGGTAIGLGYGYAGSGGGSGSPNAVASGGGGNGGGYVRLCSAGALTIASGATITALGATGGATTGYGGPGGGGSGGGIYEYSLVSITQTGTASVAGGAGGSNTASGGATASGGGGGGGGYYLRHSPSNTGAGTINVSGGAGGTAGVGANGSIDGTAGASGVSISITGTPNLPLIAQHEKQINNMVALAKIQQAVGRQGQTVEWTQKDNVAYLAALESDTSNFQQTAFLLNNGVQLDGQGEVAQIGVGDEVELGDAA